MMDIRWYGRGGQGAFTAARLLGRIASIYQGKHALAYPSFGPERRGAPVWCFTKIDEEKILDRSQPDASDYLIVLDETLVRKEIFQMLRPNGTAIINTAAPGQYAFIRQKLVHVDATRMALQVLGWPVINVAMLGAFCGASGICAPKLADQALRDFFSPDLYEKNLRLMREAYHAVKGEKNIEQTKAD